jgi:hypothetical protein
MPFLEKRIVGKGPWLEVVFGDAERWYVPNVREVSHTHVHFASVNLLYKKVNAGIQWWLEWVGASLAVPALLRGRRYYGKVGASIVVLDGQRVFLEARQYPHGKEAGKWYYHVGVEGVRRCCDGSRPRSAVKVDG